MGLSTRRGGGFGLIELMVAMLIIGALATIAIPMFHAYQLRSKSAEARGPAFVGTIDEDWAALPQDTRARAAEQLVASLRAQGVREIMIYDDAGQLRIQALGQQPARLVPAGKP